MIRRGVSTSWFIPCVLAITFIPQSPALAQFARLRDTLVPKDAIVTGGCPIRSGYTLVTGSTGQAVYRTLGRSRGYEKIEMLGLGPTLLAREGSTETFELGPNREVTFGPMPGDSERGAEVVLGFVLRAEGEAYLARTDRIIRNFSEESYKESPSLGMELAELKAKVAELPWLRLSSAAHVEQGEMICVENGSTVRVDASGIYSGQDPGSSVEQTLIRGPALFRPLGEKGVNVIEVKDSAFVSKAIPAVSRIFPDVEWEQILRVPREFLLCPDATGR